MGTLCDTAVKFKTNNPVADAKPEWVAAAGGDTIWAVAVSEHAVYVGGHQRWMNNTLGNDFAGPGAVPRSGLVRPRPALGRADEVEPRTGAARYRRLRPAGRP